MISETYDTYLWLKNLFEKKICFVEKAILENMTQESLLKPCSYPKG